MAGVPQSQMCFLGVCSPRGHRLTRAGCFRIGSSMYFHLVRRTSWSQSWLRHSCRCCSTMSCSNAVQLRFVLDNQSVLMSLVKGGSGAVDLSHLSLITHATLLTIEALAWWEYVPSASNAADGGGRTAHRDALGQYA